MLQKIINYLFWDKLVEQYTKALHAWDVETCIECVRAWTREQRDKMQLQRDLFYNINK